MKHFKWSCTKKFFGVSNQEMVHHHRDNKVMRNNTAPLVLCCIFSIGLVYPHSVGYKITFHWNRQFCQDIPVESCSWASDSFWSSHSISGFSVLSAVTKQSLQICHQYNPLLPLWSSSVYISREVQRTPYFLCIWKIPYVYRAQTSLFIFQISCEILCSHAFFCEVRVLLETYAPESFRHTYWERNWALIRHQHPGAIWSCLPIDGKKSHTFYQVPVVSHWERRNENTLKDCKKNSKFTIDRKRTKKNLAESVGSDVRAVCLRPVLYCRYLVPGTWYQVPVTGETGSQRYGDHFWLMMTCYRMNPRWI